MKAKIFLICISFLFFSGNIFSQNKNEVANGKIKKSDFSDTKVMLKYELPAGDFPNIGYEVTFKIKLPNEELNVQVGLNGDFGENVLPSKNLFLIWNFTEEGFVKSDVKDAEMIITGKRSVPTVVPKDKHIGTTPNVKLPSVVLPSATIVAGIGILGLGISRELKAKDDYAFYKENVLAGEVIPIIEKDENGLDTIVSNIIITDRKKLHKRREMQKGFSFQPEIKFYNNVSTSVGGKIVFTF